MGMEFALTWLRQVSPTPPPTPLLHKTTLTTEYSVDVKNRFSTLGMLPDPEE